MIQLSTLLPVLKNKNGSVIERCRFYKKILLND